MRFAESTLHNKIEQKCIELQQRWEIDEVSGLCNSSMSHFCKFNANLLDRRECAHSFVNFTHRSKTLSFLMKHSLDCDTTNYYIDIFYTRQSHTFMHNNVDRKKYRKTRTWLVAANFMSNATRNLSKNCDSRYRIIETIEESRSETERPKEAYFNIGIDRNKIQNKNNCNWWLNCV